MNAGDRDAWRKFVGGQRAAEEIATRSRRPVPPETATRRLESLQRLASIHRGPATSDAEANLEFHLRWATLRRKLQRSHDSAR